MNETKEIVCDKTEHLCFELTLNLSNWLYYDTVNRTNDFMNLTKKSSSYWMMIAILFFFISVHFIIFMLEKRPHYDNLNDKFIEIIDFTNESQYRLLSDREFKLRYGSRSSIIYEKPYHFYRHLFEKSKD